MKQFVITMRVLKEYPDMDSACAAVKGMNGHWEDCIDFTVEELNEALALEIIAELDEIGGTGIEGESTGTVLDFQAAKNRRLNS